MRAMNDQAIARLEAKLEHLIEGAFAQLFSKTIRAQDIALHLAPGQLLRVGLWADLGTFDDQALRRAEAGRLPLDGRFELHAGMPVRGVATSGWRGRSFSLGIADSVTVLATTAAMADAAATVVANAVNLDDPRIQRRPADELQDDSDLGHRRVTVDVPALSPDEALQALASGLRAARVLQRRGLLHAAALVCQGRMLRLDAAGAIDAVGAGGGARLPGHTVPLAQESRPPCH